MKTNKEIITEIINGLDLKFNPKTKINKKNLIECWSIYCKEYEFYGYATQSSVSKAYIKIFKNINKVGKESWKSYILRLNEYKFCTTCEIVKNIGNFSTDSNSPTGLKISCKLCRSKEYTAYRKNNVDKEAERHKLYYKNNKDKIRTTQKLYRKNNPEVMQAILAKRRASKLKRTPPWLTEDDVWMMQEAYSLAKEREKCTGIKWHVDHLIPLQGKLVSGLHVPNNLQVITATKNLSKSNNYVI